MQHTYAWTAAVSATAALSILLAPRASASEAACRALGQTSFRNTMIASIGWVAPTGSSLAYCEIAATLTPVTDSRIGAVYRLPENWNGKVLGLGGGGWAGNTTLASAANGLSKGYATLQTDTGHPVAQSFDTRWAIDAAGRPKMTAIEDFGYRAVHEMTRIGKEVVAAYYGKSHRYAYWQGCSTGGRQGFMEVQRYPEDYDGVIAGAPVYDLLTTTGAMLRYNNFSPPQRALSAAHLQLINKAVLKACDAMDGASDGIVNDPRACDWDPKELECAAGVTGNACLTGTQIDAVRSAYRGVRSRDGSIAAYPLSRGSELGWTRFSAPNDGPPGDAASVGMSGLRAAFFEDPNYDLTRFDADADVKNVRASALAKTYEATDPDISPFVRRGGKLLVWHGFYDPGPGPAGTIKYYEDALRATRGSADLTQSLRLFLAPGVAHCGGGPGPDQIDFLSALEAWVEQGKAPQQIVATKKDSTLAWPLCAYPAVTKGRHNEGVAEYVCGR